METAIMMNPIEMNFFDAIRAANSKVLGGWVDEKDERLVLTLDYESKTLESLTTGVPLDFIRLAAEKGKVDSLVENVAEQINDLVDKMRTLVDI